jgi:hypothetical protein
MLVVNYAAQLDQLELVRLQRLQGGYICLFGGAVTPGLGDTTATYLPLEASFPGYSRQVCNAWGSSSINSDSVAQTAENAHTWTATSYTRPTQTIAGAFYLGSDSVLLWAELLPGGPVAITNVGDAVGYQPVYTLGSVYD